MTTECAHIEIDNGIPYIAGTGMKVRGIVLNHQIFDWDGRELQENFPHLTHAQVYAALAYYYDHKDAIDAEIDESERYAESIRSDFEDQAQKARLSELKAQRLTGKQ